MANLLSIAGLFGQRILFSKSTFLVAIIFQYFEFISATFAMAWIFKSSLFYFMVEILIQSRTVSNKITKWNQKSPKLNKKIELNLFSDLILLHFFALRDSIYYSDEKILWLILTRHGNAPQLVKQCSYYWDVNAIWRQFISINGKICTKYLIFRLTQILPSFCSQSPWHAYWGAKFW